MIIAHSEKSMATLPEKNYWLHILEKHVFFSTFCKNAWLLAHFGKYTMQTTGKDFQVKGLSGCKDDSNVSTKPKQNNSSCDTSNTNF